MNTLIKHSPKALTIVDSGGRWLASGGHGPGIMTCICLVDFLTGPVQSSHSREWRLQIDPDNHDGSNLLRNQVVGREHRSCQVRGLNVARKLRRGTDCNCYRRPFPLQWNSFLSALTSFSK